MGKKKVTIAVSAETRKRLADLQRTVPAMRPYNDMATVETVVVYLMDFLYRKASGFPVTPEDVEAFEIATADDPVPDNLPTAQEILAGGYSYDRKTHRDEQEG